MTHRHRCSAASVVWLALTVGLSGCATSRTSQFSLAFLPATPSAPPPLVPPVAPAEPAPVVAASTVEPVVFIAAPKPAPPVANPIELRIQLAEHRFQRAKRYYQDGQMEAARQEFDRALDTLLAANESEIATDRQRLERRLDEMASAIHRYDIEGLGSGVSSQRPSFDKAPLDDILELTFPVNPELRPKVKEQVQATASQLPLIVNDTVLGYINFFNGDRGRRTLVAGLKRAGRYKPMISRILAEEGVPQELIFLAQAESGFLPRAVSYKAAVGMWQFIQARGREYGLLQTGHTDDRLDPEKATRAAARHLRDLYEKFGDWHLAIAAYNCGDGCVDRAVQRTGYADYWELRERRAIPRETTNYVPIIVAMTIMAKNPAQYGIENVQPDAPIEYDTIETDASTHLGLVAALADCPIADLRDLNPSLLANVAPVGHPLRVPRGKGVSIRAGIEAVPLARRATWRLHRVSQGETLSAIARQYRTSPDSILEASRTTEQEMASGDVLVIPTAYESVRAAAGKLKAAPSRKKVSATAKSRVRKGNARVASSSRRPVAKSTARASFRRGSARASR